MTAKSNKSAKVAPAKVAKTAKVAKIAKVEAQVPAVELPTAQLPAVEAKKREQPMWQGKPISAAGLVYHQRKEAGVCVKCGKPLAEGSTLLCDAHLAYHNKWHGNRKAQAQAKEQELAAKELELIALRNKVAELTTAPAKPAKTARKSK